MPGKVNPVMSEMMMQVAAQVVGTMHRHLERANGNFELNVMMPVMAHNLLGSIDSLATASKTFATTCVDGIEVNAERVRELPRSAMR